MRTSEVRNPFVSPAIIPVDAIASSHSIYATTPPSDAMASSRSIYATTSGLRNNALVAPDRFGHYARESKTSRFSGTLINFRP
ncbi:MAG: hypothetical protein V3Q69_11995 [Burkholderia sp.]